MVTAALGAPPAGHTLDASVLRPVGAGAFVLTEPEQGCRAGPAFVAGAASPENWGPFVCSWEQRKRKDGARVGADSGRLSHSNSNGVAPEGGEGGMLGRRRGQSCAHGVWEVSRVGPAARQTSSGQEGSQHPAIESPPLRGQSVPNEGREITQEGGFALHREGWI